MAEVALAILLALPAVLLWAFSSGSLMLGIGAFLVQGAWGVVPTYLSELVPANTRAVLPGFVYQLGNLIASVNATLQATIAEHIGHNYGLVMGIIGGTVAVTIALLVFFARVPGARLPAVKVLFGDACQRLKFNRFV